MKNNLTFLDDQGKILVVILLTLSILGSGAYYAYKKTLMYTTIFGYISHNRG